MDAGKSGGTSAGAGASSGSKGASASGGASKGVGGASKGASAAGGVADASKSTASKSATDSVSLSAESKTSKDDAKTDVNFEAWGLAEASETVAKDEAAKADEAKAKENTELSEALGEKTMRSGATGKSVESLQSALNDKLGLSLKTDGKFGKNTQAAVRDFQKQNGLQVDGVVGPATRAALTGAGAHKDKAIEDAVSALPDNVPVPTARPDQPADAQAKDPAAKTDESSLSFGAKLSDEQKAGIKGIAADLTAKGFKVDANDVANFMAVETAGTFSTTITSGKNGKGAVGLAQFTNIAIEQMNKSRAPGDKLSKDKISKMDFTQQSKVVTEYLSDALGMRGMKGKAVSGADLYTAVFSPAAVGKPMNSTVYSKSGSRRNYNANRSLDKNRDGRITKAELTSRLNDWARQGEALRQ